MWEANVISDEMTLSLSSYFREYEINIHIVISFMHNDSRRYSCNSLYPENMKYIPFTTLQNVFRNINTR